MVHDVGQVKTCRTTRATCSSPSVAQLGTVQPCRFDQSG